jgi:hypothetical protein
VKGSDGGASSLCDWTGGGELEEESQRKKKKWG